MPVTRQEITSPLLKDWIFEDELGIQIACGRFITPDREARTVIARMAKFILNDGRSGVARTSAFRTEDPYEIHMSGVPYNIAEEFHNRVGVRFRIRNYLGDWLWAVLEQGVME